MNRLKWYVAAMVMGTLFLGCKAKEQTAETQPPEKPKAEAPAEPKAETPATSPAPPPTHPEAKATPPAAATRQCYDRALLRAAPLAANAPSHFHTHLTYPP